MIALAEKASPNGEGIYASKQTIADETDLSKQSVINSIKSLTADGLIREVGQRPCKRGYTVEYEIVVDALYKTPLTPSGKRRVQAESSGQRAAPVKQVDRSESKTGTSQTASPKPLLEPNTPHIPPSEGTASSARAGSTRRKRRSRSLIAGESFRRFDAFEQIRSRKPAAEQSLEGPREEAIRGALVKATLGFTPDWLQLSGLKCETISNDEGPLGLIISCPPERVAEVKVFEGVIAQAATKISSYTVSWVRVRETLGVAALQSKSKVSHD